MKKRLFLLFFLLMSCSEPVEESAGDVSATRVESFELTPDSREVALGPVHGAVSVSDASPRLGQTITLTLRVDVPEHVSVTMPEFGDQLGQFTIVDYRTGETLGEDGRYVHEQVYTLDLPMSGTLRTPSFLIEFVDDRPESEMRGKVQEVLTEELLLEVGSVFGDGEVGAELFPERDALGELVVLEPNRFGHWPWILGILILAGGVVGGILLRQRTRVEVCIPPDVTALAALEGMQGATIPTEKGALNAWYVQLSSVVRHYLEGRFSLEAPRLTTEEFFELAKRSAALSSEQKTMLMKLLERSDRVKFADYLPTVEESREALSAAYQFVLDTREDASRGNLA